MIDQQLYIDGVLMDLPENTDVVLDIKSNLFVTSENDLELHVHHPVATDGAQSFSIAASGQTEERQQIPLYFP